MPEAAVVADSGGNLIEDPSRERIFGKDISSGETVVNDYGYIFPGETIHKDKIVANCDINKITYFGLISRMFKSFVLA